MDRTLDIIEMFLGIIQTFFLGNGVYNFRNNGKASVFTTIYNYKIGVIPSQMFRYNVRHKMRSVFSKIS